MGIKEGLLALLTSKPAHGYQLKLAIEEAVGETWHLNIGQVYTTLQRLERDGLVHSSGSDPEGRVVYEITDMGRGVAIDWMSSPERLAVEGRDEISLKLLLAVFSGVASPRRVVEVQRGATMKALQDYTRLKADDREGLAWQLHLDRLILSAEAELRWLDRVENKLEGKQTPILAVDTDAEVEVER